MRVSLRAIGLRAKACALRDVREKSLNYDNGADIMRSNEAIKGWRQGSGSGGGGGGRRRLTVSMADVGVAGWRELRVPGSY